MQLWQGKRKKICIKVHEEETLGRTGVVNTLIVHRIVSRTKMMLQPHTRQ